MNLFPPDSLAFRKSSYSERNNCVEVADLPGGSAVRDSQNPAAGHLEVPASEWRALLAGVRSAK
ncbi:DUF397 domain-containing protein [Nocardiopsis sp. HNM0947]|uniref:DUF397 domain-containing protein n=1 Tax=Nocardiopsis coralli TaxID=2772213 RepID=A0ABR9PBT4_9ACTN|nr:DUF397 domain-containing protein [Nocardiopsis coralli]MBE3001296.1 DUF397 domain-containing protein [Nocardiopsis coralli]